MAVTVYTSLLGFALPTTGDLAGTWGDVVNDEITSLVDSAIAGTTSLSADTDVTLTTTDGVANQSRQAILNCTGARTVITNITAPAASKTYYIINATTGGYAVVIRGVGPTTGVSIPAGTKAIVAWNGTDFVKIASSTISLTSDVTGILPAANGGTGASTLAGASIATYTGAETLTNKRIDPRVSSAASASSVTPSIASYDVYAFTALAAGLTINAPNGTPVDGNKLVFRILDNGTARALTWNATYTAIGITLPTTTVISKTVYVGCIYNANNTRWDVVAVATQA